MIPWASPNPQPKRHLHRYIRFRTGDSGEHTLQWDPVKIAPSRGGSEPQSNTWFPGPTRVLNPNGISIASTVFAGLTSVTDGQTTLLGREQ